MRQRAHGFGDTSTCATIRPARIANIGITSPGCRERWLGRHARHRTHEDRTAQSGRDAECRGAKRRDRTPRQPLPARRQRRPDRPRRAARLSLRRRAARRAIPATRSPPRCSPSAVRLVGRSFKYHRPRGVLTAGPEEPNALVELRAGARREPNTRATTTELFDGLEATSQNRWPSLRFDLGAINSLASPILIAGFYYKTFMWPAALLGTGLRAADPPRRGTGPGERARPIPTLTRRPSRFATCWSSAADPPGLAAALAAGRAGARVILCDDDFRLGGRLNAERFEIDGRPGAQWAEDAARGTGGARQRSHLHAHDGLRRLRQRRLWRAGARRRSSSDAAAAPAAPAALAHRRQARGAGRRRARAADRVRRQRPAGRDAGLRRCAPISTASPSPRPRRRHLHHGRRRLAHGRDLAAAGSASRRSSMRGPTSRLRLRALAGRGAARLLGATSPTCAAAGACVGVEIVDARRATIPWSTPISSPSPAAGTRSSASTTHLGGKPRWRERHRRLRPGRSAAEA